MTRNSGTHVSSPGRVILFGDHAVDHGGPALAVGVEFRVHCRAELSSSFMVNGQDLDPKKHRHARGAVLQGWTDMDKPISIEKESYIPPGYGLGEDAASTVACLGAISMMHDHMILGEVARNAYAVQRDINQEARPLDIAVSTHGRGIFLSPDIEEDILWNFGDWKANGLDLPELDLVLGYTGSPSREIKIKSKINRFVKRNSFARDIMKDLCKISAKGYQAVRGGDPEHIGRLMSDYHKLLVTLGAGSPGIDRLVKAVSRHSHGAKLTGAGGGGCIIALVHDKEGAVEAIERAGGKAHVPELAQRGIRLED